MRLLLFSLALLAGCGRVPVEKLNDWVEKCAKNGGLSAILVGDDYPAICKNGARFK